MHSRQDGHHLHCCSQSAGSCSQTADQKQAEPNPSRATAGVISCCAHIVGAGGGMTFTFVFDHKVFVKWQVHSVHAKLPGLCAFWSAGARVVPDQVCGYQRATWLMHKHYLHAIVECPCRLVKKRCHSQTSFYLTWKNEINCCSCERPQSYGRIFAAHSAGMQQGGSWLQHMTAQITCVVSYSSWGNANDAISRSPR